MCVCVCAPVETLRWILLILTMLTVALELLLTAAYLLSVFCFVFCLVCVCLLLFLRDSMVYIVPFSPRSSFLFVALIEIIHKCDIGEKVIEKCKVTWGAAFLPSPLWMRASVSAQPADPSNPGPDWISFSSSAFFFFFSPARTWDGGENCKRYENEQVKTWGWRLTAAGNEGKSTSLKAGERSLTET